MWGHIDAPSVGGSYLSVSPSAVWCHQQHTEKRLDEADLKCGVVSLWFHVAFAVYHEMRARIFKMKQSLLIEGEHIQTSIY